VRSLQGITGPSGAPGIGTLSKVVGTISSLSGATGTASSLIPAGAWVVSVTAENKSTIAGSLASYKVGDGTDTDRWGGTIPLTNGNLYKLSSGVNIASIPLYTSANNVVVTAEGGTFSSGTIEITVYYLSDTAGASDFLKDHFSGLEIRNDDTSPTTTLAVEPGTCYTRDGATLLTLAAAGSCDITATGDGGMNRITIGNTWNTGTTLATAVSTGTSAVDALVKRSLTGTGGTGTSNGPANGLSNSFIWMSGGNHTIDRAHAGMLVGTDTDGYARITDVQSSDDGSTTTTITNAVYRISLSQNLTISAGSTIQLVEIATIRMGSVDTIVDLIEPDIGGSIERITTTDSLGSQSGVSASYNTKVASSFPWLWLLSTGALRFSYGRTEPGNGLVGRPVCGMHINSVGNIAMRYPDRIGSVFRFRDDALTTLLPASDVGATPVRKLWTSPPYTRKILLLVDVFAIAAAGLEEVVLAQVGRASPYWYIFATTDGVRSFATSDVWWQEAEENMDPSTYISNTDSPNAIVQLRSYGWEVQL